MLIGLMKFLKGIPSPEKKVLQKSVLVLILIFFLTAFSACQEEKAPIPVLEQNTGTKDIEAFGTVGIQRSVAISFDFPVKLMSIDVWEGQHTEYEQVLGTLDLHTLDEERENMQEEINLLTEELNRLQQKATEKEASLENQTYPELQKLLFMIEVQHQKKAELLAEYERKSVLVTGGSLPSDTLSQPKQQINDTEIEIQSLLYSIEILKHQYQQEITQLMEETLNKQIQIDVLTSKRKKIGKLKNQAWLKNEQIICPVKDGIISEIRHIEGDTINSSDVLFVIEDLDTMTVIADVNEQFIHSVQEGSTATVIPDANRDYSFRGKVTFISAKAVRLSGETVIPVHITLDQKNSFLKPGYNVQVLIQPADDIP
ncbi:MAG: efflux RND transporter periplasmic adaptor subunit [Thermoclostridium sp.]|nr:efflux RND transporter periplasmic adaptor subunit [Thermoclostridium sp.]